MQPKITLAFSLLLLSATQLLSGPDRPMMTDIKTNLTCGCDCNMTVEACEGSMACKSAEQLTFEASQYVDQGMGKDAILAAFVQKYGEQILAAPTKRGFNLTAWILPFVGLIAGAFGIVIILKKWVKRQKKASPKMTRLIDAASGESSAYESELDVVLKQLD